MKIVVLIARILLGLVFVVFGADKLFHFIPQGPLPTGAAGEFTHALMTTKYMVVVGLIEMVGGLLLLIGRYVPVGLCLIGPIIVNILLVDFLMLPQGIVIGLIVTLLWFLIFYRERSAFAGIFRAKA